MGILKSNLSVTSDIFIKNKSDLLFKVDGIKKVKDFAFKGGVKKFNKKTSKEKKLPNCKIELLIVNKKEAYAVERAKKHNIAFRIIE